MPGRDGPWEDAYKRALDLFRQRHRMLQCTVRGLAKVTTVTLLMEKVYSPLQWMALAA